jgi:hypothetical protein
LALVIEKDPRITWYSIASENLASFHNHNGYAQINRQKTDSAKAWRKRQSFANPTGAEEVPKWWNWVWAP